MDPRLLRYYNQELQHLRETGAEFAEQFPKIARRLGMEALEVTDPYVERLMEGAAFMAARVQLKLDAEFPRFTQRMLELVYPNYLAPVPSMMIAQLNPQLNETNLADGFMVPRGSLMRSQAVQRDVARCEFTTAQDVRLWPLEVVTAKYFTFAPELPLSQLPYASKIKGGLRIRLSATAGLKFNQLKLDNLRLFYAGNDEVAYRLHQLACGHLLGAMVVPVKPPYQSFRAIAAESCVAVGYADEHALLPAAGRSLLGYRLLQEYFAFPQRFLFQDIGGLLPALSAFDDSELELVLLFERGDSALERLVDAGNVALNCTPAINLFNKRADRIHISEKDFEFHVVGDRTKPLDYEIYSVDQVAGYGSGVDSEQIFTPFYQTRANAQERAYFTVQREPRMVSEKQLRTGFRSSYIGSEVFIALVDANEAPFNSNLKQLAVNTTCTNRDLPLILSLGLGKTDFVLDSAAPLESIRCIKGPSKPYSPLTGGKDAWRLISQLSLNYLSLINNDPQQGAAALREMLELYVTSSDVAILRQIQGLRSINTRAITKRLSGAGPICFGRGLEIQLEVDDLAFQGGSAYLFGSVLSEFFARHVSLNSFTETILNSTTQGKIKHWETQWGKRAIL